MSEEQMNAGEALLAAIADEAPGENTQDAGTADPREEMARTLREQGDALGKLRAMVETLQGRLPAQEQSAPPAETAYQAQMARCQGRAEQLFRRYKAQGGSEEAARQQAWEDAVSEDTLTRTNTQAMVQQMIGPYLEALHQDVLPATIQREVTQVVGDGVQAGEVLDVLSQTLHVPVAALSTLAPELRQGLYRLAGDAARGRQSGPRETVAPALTPAGALTRNTAQSGATVDAGTQSKIARLKRAFPSLTEKELTELV